MMTDPQRLANALQLPACWHSLPQPLRQRIGFVSTWRGEEPGHSVFGLNLGLHVNDDIESVKLRRLALARTHGVQPVWMKQVHGTECRILGNDAYGLDDSMTADAAFTQTAGVAAVVMTADCLPVLLTDHRGRAVAAAHCGWRGLANGVLQRTLEAFEAHGLADGPFHAWLGPCIGPDSFEVGEEVRQTFLARDGQLRAFFKPRAESTAATATPEKWLADLPGIARHLMQQNHAVNVEWDGRDTFTDPMLNSFRRNPQTGRQASLIWLKEGAA